MTNTKKVIVKNCGPKGMASRSLIRGILSGTKITKNKTQLAIAHIEKCKFCQKRIKNDIYNSRKGRQKNPYLFSLKETLEETKKLIGKN